MWPLFIFFYISIFSNSICPLDLDRWLWQGPAADGNLSPSSARRWWRPPASACSPRPRRARRRGRTSSRSKGSSSRSLAAALYRSSTLPARRKKANRLRDPLEFCKIEYICFCSGEMSIRNICLSQYHVSNSIYQAKASKFKGTLETLETVLSRPSALGMSDPIWGPLIHIFVDERRSAKDKVFRPSKL